MSVIVAACLILSSLELALLRKSPMTVRRLIVLQIPGVLDIMVGMVTIALYAVVITTGWEPSLENAFLNLFWHQDTRLALLTAILLTVIGCVLMLLANGGRRASNIAHALILPAVMVSYLVPVSYFLGAENAYVALGIPIAINTGIALCALGVAILAAFPDTWIMRVFTADHAGSIMARRLLPAILLIPLMIIWLRLYGERSGALVSDLGVVIAGGAFTFCLLGLMWLTAAMLNRVDAERRSSEDAQRESEQRLRLQRERMPIGCIVYDENFRFVELNPAAERIFGYSAGELIGRHAQVIVPPDAQPLVEGILRRLAAGEMTAHSVNENLTRDGRTILCDWLNTPLKDSQGTFLGFLTMVQDVTEKKAAEESANLLAAIVESSDDAIISKTLDGEITSWNRAAEAMYGYTAEEVIGRSISILAPLEVHNEFPSILEKIRGSEAVEHFETRLRGKNDEAIDVSLSVSPIRDTSGKIVGASTIARDITEHRRMEEELLENQSRLQLALRSAQMGVWHLDIAQSRRVFDDQVCRMLGIEPAKFTGTEEEFFNAVHPDDHDRVKAALARTLEHHAPYETDYRAVWPDGSIHYITTRGSLLRDDKGQPIRLNGLIWDITEHQQMDLELRKSHYELELRVEERTDELEKYMRKLEESNQALQDFASIASHDLQEPLRKVEAFGNMLKRKCGESLDEQGNSYLERVLNANQRMQRLLTALLEYSRLSTMAAPFTEVELSMVVEEVLSDLEVRIVRTGGMVHVGDLPVIQAEPTQMRQLFQNLIGNALKFCKADEKPVVEVRGAATNGKLRIEVQDNGIGFEERYLDRIFSPFQRLHGKASGYEGTGMGLAICKKIVERHGGSITAKSVPGEGSLFVIDLRVKQTGL
jgi:PAS domain S-box-containing protein